MPIPTSYPDEAALADYMAAELSDLGRDLNMTATATATSELGSFTEPVTDTLIAYGEITDIAEVTEPAGIAKLRALARLYAWRAAVKACAARYNFADGTSRFDLGATQAQAIKALAIAEAEAAPFIGAVGAPVVQISPVRRVYDPYR